MNELVGKCSTCGKEIYCENGFLNGINENGKLACFECGEEKKED